MAWELDNAQSYSLRSLVFMGRFEELSRRLPSYLKDAQMRGDLYVETILRTRVSYNLLLAPDKPEKARQEIREMLARWSHRGYHLQHYYDLHGQAEIDLYEGNPKAAWERVSSGWPAFERSLLRRAQLIFLESAHLRARAVVAAVAAGDLPSVFSASPSATPAGSSAKRCPGATRSPSSSGRPSRRSGATRREAIALPRLRRERLRGRRRGSLRRRGPRRRGELVGGPEGSRLTGGGGGVDVEGAHREPRAPLHAPRPALPRSIGFTRRPWKVG